MNLPFFCFTIGIAIETVSLTVFFQNNILSPSPLFFLSFLLHCAGITLYSYGIYKGAAIHHFNSPTNWFIISLLLCFIFPGVGVLSMLFIYIVMARHPWEKSAIYDEYERYITFDFKPEEKRMAPDRLFEEIESELEVSPLVDVMGQDDIPLRRGAIHVMNKLPKKDAVRLLKMSTSDKNLEIRFCAAAELSELEAEINENINMAKKEVERNPGSGAAHLSLANAYAEYYECGILDDITAAYYMDLAYRQYSKVLDLMGPEVKVLNYLGNLETQRKKYDDACKIFGRVLELDPENVFANVGIIQTYYETGQIERVIRYARGLAKRMPETKGPMREIIQFWAS